MAVKEYTAPLRLMAPDDLLWIAIPCLAPPLLFAAGRGEAVIPAAPGEHPFLAAAQAIFLLGVAGWLVRVLLGFVFQSSWHGHLARDAQAIHELSASNHGQDARATLIRRFSRIALQALGSGHVRAGRYGYEKAAASCRTPKSAIHNPQSAIRNEFSALRAPRSALGSIRNPQSAIRNEFSALRTPRSALGSIRNPQSAIRNRKWLDYVRLTKPALNALVLVSVLMGFYLASPGPLAVTRLLFTLGGSALLAGAASAFNQVIERGPDRRMPRTAERPVAAGRLAPRQGLRFGALLALTGMGLLALAVNLAAAFAATLSFAVYVWLYTPLKRHSTLATLAGAVSGAMPPLLGWFGAGGRLTPAALVLFATLYLWQIPHFLAIAWKYREQYREAGFRLYGVLDPTGRATGLQALLYTAALLPVSLMMTWQGVTRQPYLLGAFVLGLSLLGFSAAFALEPAPRPARRLFIASIGYLPLLFLFMVLDHWLG